MGRLWRAYKSELTSSVMTVLDSRHNRTETTRLLGLIKLTDVPQAEWDAFVAERSSGEWKTKSEKMKAVRAKQLLPHTLSRKGYAREEYEHKLKTGQTTRSFLKGHEKSKNKYVQKKCDATEIGEKETTPSPMTRNSKSVQGSCLQQLGVNQPCNILDWLDTDEVVAKGRISAVDPLTTVHGYKLGPDCYRVEIEEAINPRAEFYRFQPEFSTMEDVIGSTIAWPTKYIAPRT